MNPRLDRRNLYDKFAGFFIVMGGVAIIVSILAVFAFILSEALPLFSSPSHGEPKTVIAAGPLAGAVGAGVDEYRETAYAVFPSGEIKLFSLSGGGSEVIAAAPAGATAFAVHTSGEAFALGLDDGSVAVYSVGYREVHSEEGKRSVETAATLSALSPKGISPVSQISFITSEEGSYTVAAHTENGRLFLFAGMGAEEDDDIFADSEAAQTSPEQTPRTELTRNLSGERVTALALSEEGSYLYAGTAEGRILSWNTSDPLNPEFLGKTEATADRSISVTAMGALLGSRSVTVGDSSGAVSIWFRAADSPQLMRARDFKKFPGAVVLFANSQRNRGFLAADSEGNIGVFHSTTERKRLSLESGQPVSAAFLAPKGNAVVAVGDDGSLTEWEIRNDYSEISLKSLFNAVWYEGYESPEHMWQSTGGTDEFEPKLGLAPIIFGTFKGAVYSLLFAVPVAVFAALCVSQFLHPSFGKVVKPIIEIMAGLPSVVIGFFAGLWLSPVLEKVFPALVIMPFVMAGTGAAVLYLWKLFGGALKGRMKPGAEFMLLLPAIFLAVALSLWLNTPAEQFLFRGDYKEWLAAAGLDFDQRNALVVGFAMGFAVIPIVFTIAEDSMSGVPKPLVAGSLALGASKWQTAVRVVIPSASAGILAAVVIGFGRAVGETMIVLMATGNTPLLDWNIFNGFRTMSANIAVELPEAPHGGGLYRLIFFTSLLLFVFTFVLNTAAEIIRGKLGKKYGTPQ